MVTFQIQSHPSLNYKILTSNFPDWAAQVHPRHQLPKLDQIFPEEELMKMEHKKKYSSRRKHQHEKYSATLMTFCQNFAAQPDLHVHN